MNKINSKLKTLFKEDLSFFITLCEQASHAILDVYKGDIDVQLKKDQSPFTLADEASHHILTKGLSDAFPHIPIISEEHTHDISVAERQAWSQHWLVDPLDGSKEFIKKNDQFCIILSYLKESKPYFGIMYEPVTGNAYIGLKGEGAYKLTKTQGLQQLQSKAPTKENLRIIGSLSHSSREFDAYVEEKKQDYQNVTVHQIGSGLKFCHVAEGIADCYPRFVPTMEWDTAAGQLLVEEVGKTMIDNETGESMKYNKDSLRNNGFIVQ